MGQGQITQMRGNGQNPHYVAPATPYYIPTVQRKKLQDMKPNEVTQYTWDLHRRLAAKKQRERDYLDRRASRGTHTPTDDVYENDQILEDEILSILEELIEFVNLHPEF